MSAELGPWAEWTPEEIFNEIYAELPRVIPAPADDDGGPAATDG